MSQIKLGILGLSEGNGHPYSWSAIFNGYDPEQMSRCPFPVIPQYLSKQTFPDDAIADARVTHIWTQDKTISNDVAKACGIEHVVDDYEEMIGQVDAVLLARDDAENHYAMSKPFLKAGLPVYIDKPIATTLAEVQKIYEHEQFEGQIFTCSALNYAREFQLNDSDWSDLGDLQEVKASVMKDWQKYSVHIIEPVLRLIGDQGSPTKFTCEQEESTRTVQVEWQNGIKTIFQTLGQTTSQIMITLKGTKGERTLVFEDTFYAFKKALRSFVDVVQKKVQSPSKDHVFNVVRVIEGGLA